MIFLKDSETFEEPLGIYFFYLFTYLFILFIYSLVIILYLIVEALIVLLQYLTVSDYILLEFCVFFCSQFYVLFYLLVVSFIVSSSKDSQEYIFYIHLKTEIFKNSFETDGSICLIKITYDKTSKNYA